MTQPNVPLEIKTLIIRELSPYDSIFNPRYTPVSEDEKAAYFRDLCTVCLLWPDTIAIIRKILFKTITLRSNDHQIESSLRNLCQALKNDPNLCTFVKTLEFSNRNTNAVLSQNCHCIPTAGRPFLSFLSFIPKMHQLKHLHLDNMHFHEDTSFPNDLCIFKESSVTHLTLANCSFPISAFNMFLSYWENLELEEICIDGISLIPMYRPEERYGLQEHVNDWDDEDTWTEWGVDKPRKASFLFVTDLDLTLSISLASGMLMLMDFLSSDTWSPLAYVHTLRIFGDGSAMSATTVNRLNSLIRRYEPSDLWLCHFRDFEDATGTPLYLSGVERTQMRLGVCQDFALNYIDEDLFHWYIESLSAVAPNSRFRELTLYLDILVPLEAKDLGLQGSVWGILDSALSSDNLQLDTLSIELDLELEIQSRTGSKTRGLKELETWLMEICFPKVTAKYWRHAAEEKKMSRLAIWIGCEQFDANKQY